ncbi:hypothetical protein MTsPCn5_27720 [Croceitalea sp. MTPC5]|nr:hypothetical protein MTsPCn5_27720 [Croceitalea sp. MTPC5]
MLVQVVIVEAILELVTLSKPIKLLSSGFMINESGFLLP